MTDPIGTAQERELITKLRRKAGNVSFAPSLTLEHKAADALQSRIAEVGRLEEALKDVLAHLAAAISLLEHSPKKGAPSDKMFDQMLIDYRASRERGRAALSLQRRPT